jgi:hypothetical protein
MDREGDMYPDGINDNFHYRPFYKGLLTPAPLNPEYTGKRKETQESRQKDRYYRKCRKSPYKPRTVNVWDTVFG